MKYMIQVLLDGEWCVANVYHLGHGFIFDDPIQATEAIRRNIESDKAKGNKYKYRVSQAD